MKMEQKSAPKRWQIKFIRRGITQKKGYNIHLNSALSRPTNVLYTYIHFHILPAYKKHQHRAVQIVQYMQPSNSNFTFY